MNLFKKIYFELNEAANYIPFSKKMSEEEFLFVRDTDPKKLEWIIGAYLRLTPEQKDWFKENKKNIENDLSSWYKMSSQARYIRDGYIKSKDLKAELINILGEHDFEKLHNLINKLSSGEGEGSSEINKIISDNIPGEHKIIFQNGSWILAEVFNHEASVFFGRHKCNGKVCVSRPGDDHYYKEYMGKDPNKSKGRLFFLRHLPYDNIGLSLFLSNNNPSNDDHCDIQDVYNDNFEDDIWAISLVSEYFTANICKTLPQQLIQELDTINRNKESKIKNFAITGDFKELDKKILKKLSISPNFIINNLDKKDTLVELGIWKKINDKYHADSNIRINNTNLKVLPNMSDFIVDTFDCAFNNLLVSLEGSPQKVNTFNCISNKSLVSLEGSPQKVNAFYCYYNNKLVSLKGSPQKVNYLSCQGNDSLLSLEGSPQKVNAFYCLENKSLVSLKGSPQILNSFYCVDNKSLVSLEGFPLEINDSIDFSGNGKFPSIDSIDKYYKFIKEKKFIKKIKDDIIEK